MIKRIIIYIAAFFAFALGIKSEVYADFETKELEFSSSVEAMDYQVVDNPDITGVNSSAKCGRISTTAGQWEFIWSKPMARYINFDDGYTFKIKVFAPRITKIYFKIEHPNDWQEGQLEVTTVSNTKVNEWEELEFDFSALKPLNNTYSKIILLFDAGENNANETWYFDDVEGPKLQAKSMLFERYIHNPILKRQIDGVPEWRWAHVANATILEPELTGEEKWKMYVRGTASANSSYGYHDQIGLLYQDTADFSPYGPWLEYHNNPVLAHGEPGAYDELHLLDCAPVVGLNGDTYFYYLAKSESGLGALAGAHSTDGGYSFRKFPSILKENVGCSDAIYHDGKYYIFYGDGHWNGVSWGTLSLYVAVSDYPQTLTGADIYPVINVGGGPDDFDSYSVNGARIFRVKGIDKWLMTYQGSSVNFDYPDRFHVAYSDDLLNWTKVDNDFPMFMRGDEGTWDQGGIWYGEIFEYGDSLYLYYEGWGKEGFYGNRDAVYFSGGGSQTGVAVVATTEFVDWLDLPVELSTINQNERSDDKLTIVLSKGILTITEQEQQSEGRCEVYDISGNLLLSRDLINGTLDASSLRSGIYIVRIESRMNGILSKKIKIS